MKPGCFVLDRDGIVSSWNSGAAVLFGLDASDVQNQPLPSWLKSALESVLARVFVGEVVASEAVVLPRSDGRYLDMHLSAGLTETPDRAIFFATAFAPSEAHLNRVLRAIRKVNQLISTAEAPDVLIRAACALLVEDRGYSSALILLEDKEGRVTDYAQAGMGGAFEAIEERLRRGLAPECCVRARGAPGSFHVTSRDRLCIQCGLVKDCPDNDVLCAPLRHDGVVHGSIAVTMALGLGGTDHQVALLDELAADLAYALGSLRAKTVEKATAETLRDRETELSAERDNLQSTLDAAPVGLLVLDESERVVKANAAAERLFHTRISDLVQRRCGDFLGCAYRHEDKLGCGKTSHCRVCPIFGAIREALQRGVPTRDLELEAYVDAQGEPEPRWLVANVEPLVLDGRRHAIAALHDITDRKKATEALATSEAKARAMYERLPMPTFVWQRQEHDFVLTDYNLAAAEITQGGIEGVAGTTLSKMFAGEPEIASDIRRCYEEQTAFRREFSYEYKTVEGRRDLVVTYGYVPPDMVMIHTEDVTERRKNEERVRSSQRLEAIGQLAGGIAHDFNNLLLVINSNAEFVLEALPEADPNRADVLEIRRAGRRAAALTKQLLAFSRRQILAPRVLKLNEELDALGKMLPRLLGEDIKVEMRLAEDLGNVRADLGQIEQVVVNLAVNARDAMPEGGTLTIETANTELDEEAAEELTDLEPGHYVVLAVSDTGIGMDGETLDRAFEPFFTTKGVGKGTGLGLATVYGILKQSGGTVWIRSAPGLGTSIQVYLPRIDEVIEGARSTLAPVRAISEETVLVVEDEQAVLDLAVRILRKVGYRVLSAEGGPAALALVQQHPEAVRLLLTDVVMPHMSGRQLAERLTTRYPDMKVLYMSGYTDNAIVHHGVLDDDVHFIAKPFTHAALSRKVREVLAEEPARSTRPVPLDG